MSDLYNYDTDMDEEEDDQDLHSYDDWCDECLGPCIYSGWWEEDDDWLDE